MLDNIFFVEDKQYNNIKHTSSNYYLSNFTFDVTTRKSFVDKLVNNYFQYIHTYTNFKKNINKTQWRH